jgi:hypothetical protein
VKTRFGENPPHRYLYRKMALIKKEMKHLKYKNGEHFNLAQKG